MARKPQPARTVAQAEAVQPEVADDVLVAATVAPVRDDLAFVVTVRGPARGRWRAGRHWGPEPVSLTAADLGHDAIAALLADPELIVTTV